MKTELIDTIINSIEKYGYAKPTYWGCAIAGEVGELANLLKKLERDGTASMYDIGEELADVFIYLIIICRELDIDLFDEVQSKVEVLRERKRVCDKW